MNRPTFADPKTDFVFKRIFGSEQHKDVLVAFLNAMREGREVGLREGREDGLRNGIEELCDALGIEITEQRRRELASLDGPGLAALLVRLGQHKRWT